VLDVHFERKKPADSRVEEFTPHSPLEERDVAAVAERGRGLRAPLFDSV
jgi:hypothetical protein